MFGNFGVFMSLCNAFQNFPFTVTEFRKHLWELCRAHTAEESHHSGCHCWAEDGFTVTRRADSPLQFVMFCPFEDVVARPCPRCREHQSLLCTLGLLLMMGQTRLF